MKETGIPILIVIGCFTLVSCSVRLAKPTDADALRAGDMYPGITLEDLNAGLADYQQYCSVCHGIEDPNSQTVADWKEIVPAMARKAARAEDVPDISEEKAQSILQYLTTMTTLTEAAQ